VETGVDVDVLASTVATVRVVAADAGESEEPMLEGEGGEKDEAR
jgi:hypothetical protein